MWQVDFAASPAVLDDLKHILKVVAATSLASLICTTSQGFMHGSVQSRMLNEVSKSLCTALGKHPSASPVVIVDVFVCMQVDERVIRHVVLRREPFKPLPTTYRIARKAEKRMGVSQ
jgi:hypothetical protein